MGSGLCDLHRLPLLVPHAEIGHTVGVGHAQVLAAPDQALAMTDRFLSNLERLRGAVR